MDRKTLFPIIMIAGVLVSFAGIYHEDWTGNDRKAFLHFLEAHG
jgi:hypothetical protein